MLIKTNFFLTFLEIPFARDFFLKGREVVMETIKADDIIHIIGPNAKIGVGNACAEPQTLTGAFIKNRDRFESIEIYGMIHYWTEQCVKHNLGERFKLKVFMVDRFSLEGIKNGYTEYISRAATRKFQNYSLEDIFVLM
jgi:hypothetical protein